MVISSHLGWAQVPAAGDVVLIRAGHTVIYDVASDAVVRAIHIGGTLRFARDRETKLCVGLLKVQRGEDISEEGFDCHAAVSHGANDAPQGVLEVGTVNEPILAAHQALIRLTYIEGLDKLSFPALVCCGGRMDIHGSPKTSWVKLGKTNENASDFEFELSEKAEGWRKGDQVLVTSTWMYSKVNYKTLGYAGSVGDDPRSETVTVRSLREERGRIIVETEFPNLQHRHEGGGEFAAEVANLSRNVVIESADPEGERGHTMYHRDSSGSISHAEFRHLGKEGVLGRYPIHYHLCGDTMRGSSVIGASIWGSKNRFLTIHGTDFLVVRDCVGYRSIGHGFFLEDGTETRNVLDRNLGVLALRGKPLPEQVLSFDQNDGAAFWWSNSLNSFTRNVAVECDQHGFRFEVIASDKFDPVLPVRQADGSKKKVDIRTLPFIRFDDNEAHAQRRFGINLGGWNGLSMMDRPDDELFQDVDGVGPDKQHPFILRRTKLWDCAWAYHAGSPSVLTQRMTIHRVLYGVWRINAHLQEHEQLSITHATAGSFYYPRAGKQQQPTHTEQLEPVDDFPPVTIITHVRPMDDGTWLVQGTVADNGDIKQVLVNGQPAMATRSNFAAWELKLQPVGELMARATDEAGNTEQTPHRLSLLDLSQPQITSTHKP